MIEITTYRGWNIFFNINSETFYTVSEKFDSDQTKTSFASTKKFIDDFIKENDVFKPFWVEPKPGSIISGTGSHKKDQGLKIIGIRKDKRFIAEDIDGLKIQISEYDEKDFILKVPENKDIFIKLKELTKLREETNQKYNKEIRELQDTVKVKTLKEIKTEL